MDVQLCNSPITGNLLQHLLSQSSKLCMKEHRLIGVEGKVVGEGQGFTSKIIRVTLKWCENLPMDTLPSSVVVKVLGDSALEDLMSHMSKEEIFRLNKHLLHAHNIECSVYELDDLRNAVPMPICYAAIKSTDEKPGGLLVFEDMCGRGVVKPMSTWGTALTDGQLEGILDTLASIHAWSVNHTEWRTSIPSLADFNIMQSMLESFVNVFPRSKEKYPEVFKHLDEDKIKQLLTNAKYIELFGCDPKREYNLPLVLVHGDVHTMNMLFETKEDGKPGDTLVAMLDWQVSHQGCAVEDLTRLYIGCVSTEQRRENGDAILRRYVELYNSKLNDRSNLITFVDIKRAMDRMFAYTGVMWGCGMSMFEKATEHMKDIKGDEEKKKATERIMNYIAQSYYDALELLLEK